MLMPIEVVLFTLGETTNGKGIGDFRNVFKLMDISSAQAQ